MGVLSLVALVFVLGFGSAAVSLTQVAPINNSNFTTVIPLLNITSNVNTNCTYTLSNGSASVGPIDFGGNSMVHNVSSVSLANFTDGAINIIAFCYNSSDVTDNNTAIIPLAKDNVGPVISSLTVGPDNFVFALPGIGSNANFTIYANFTDIGLSGINASSVKVNFSSINVSAPLFNLVYNSTSTLYEATINITSVVANTSSFSFDNKLIVVSVLDNAGNGFSQGINSTFLILYNFTKPVSISPAQFNFGPSMTDLSMVTNFLAVNYIIDFQVNGTYFNLPWNGNQTVALYNFSSLNMSSPSIGTQLASLATGINVNISNSSYLNSSIFLNSTLLSSFNTTTILKLFHLPFKSLPNITNDGNGSATFMSYLYSNGSGNLTFTINHFSTYNINDLIAPRITLVSPAPNLSSQTFVINVSFNGTSSAINNASIVANITNLSGAVLASYAYSAFNCTSVNDNELVTCNKTVILDDGVYRLILNVTDSGAGSGNSAGSITYFTVDANGLPIISLTKSSFTDTDLTLSVVVTDVGSGFNGTCTTNRGDISGSSSPLSIISSGLTCETSYSYTVTCYDNNNHSDFVTQSFSTDSCSSSDSGGSGGGDAGATSFWYSTYSITPDQLGSGATVNLPNKNRMRFKFDGEYHSVGPVSIDSSNQKATLNVSSDPQIKTLFVGESWKVDLNSDGVYDLLVKLNNVSSNKANVTVSYVIETYSVPSSANSSVNNAGRNISSVNTANTSQVSSGATSSSKSSGMNIYFKIFIVVALLILAGLAYIFLRKFYNHRKFHRAIRYSE